MLLQRVLPIGLILLTMSGCARWLDNNVNTNGAQQTAINDEAARRVDVARLIVDSSPNAPQAKVDDFNKLPCPGKDAGSEEEAEQGRKCLEAATAVFLSDSLNQEARRNSVLDRLLAASMAECKQFTEHLNTMQTYGNLFTGLLATGASAAGAIVTDAPAARQFAGTAAFFSGARAEINSDVFMQQAVPVIVKAIYASQDAYLADPIGKSRVKSITDYTLWGAIADAFRYNSRCSLVSGLGSLSQAVQIAQDPGLDAVNRTLLKANTTKKIMDGKLTDSSVLNPDLTGNSAVIASQNLLNVAPQNQGSGLDVSLSATARATQTLASAVVGAQTALTKLKGVLTNNPVASDAAPAKNGTANADLAVTAYQAAINTALTNCPTKTNAQYTDLVIAASAVATADDATRARATLDLQNKQLTAGMTAQAIQAVNQAVIVALGRAASIADMAIPPPATPPTKVSDVQAKAAYDQIVKLLAVPAAPSPFPFSATCP